MVYITYSLNAPTQPIGMELGILNPANSRLGGQVNFKGGGGKDNLLTFGGGLNYALNSHVYIYNSLNFNFEFYGEKKLKCDGYHIYYGRDSRFTSGSLELGFRYVTDSKLVLGIGYTPIPKGLIITLGGAASIPFTK